jgi:hypothetical protein
LLQLTTGNRRLCAGFSKEADGVRWMWAKLIMEIDAAGPVAVPKEKIFKPKFPGIPVNQ